jgi:hypothetical protein
MATPGLASLKKKIKKRDPYIENEGTTKIESCFCSTAVVENTQLV